ncbi:unnamed protein product, partial [Ixodes persulcatus]
SFPLQGSVAVCLTAALAHYWGHLDSVGVALMYGGMVSLGVLLGCRSVLCSDERFPVVLKAHKGKKLLEQLLLYWTQEKLKEHSRLESAEKTRHVVFSRDVDARLNEILDLCIRDFVLPWYRQLVPDHQCFCMLLRSEMWRVLRNIKERCHKMDDVKLLTDHVVRRLQSHLRAARLATNHKGVWFFIAISIHCVAMNKLSSNHLSLQNPFWSSPSICISSAHSSIHRFTICIGNLYRTEVTVTGRYDLMLSLFPLPLYISIILLSFQPLGTSSPIITWLITCRNFNLLVFPSVFMNFMGMSSGPSAKKTSFFFIISDKQCEPQSTAKGDLLKSRNLSKYIKQLTYAKALCEKQLRLVGGVDWAPATEEQESLPGRKVFAFSVLMESPVCRDYLARFLQGEELGRSLLTFWQDVEEMWLSNKDEWHQRGNEIYQRYIKRPWPGVRLSKGVLRGIEAFIMANKGPEAFRQAQQEVYQAIEERYYHSFLVSEAYHNMILETQRLNLDLGSSREEERETPQAEERAPLPSGLPHPPTVTECCSLAQERLSRLEARMDEKRRALQALHATLDSDPKMVQTLEKEMESMRGQCDRLAAYIERLQAWIQGLGLWTASIHSSQIVKDSNMKPVPYFAILVSVPDSGRSGWMVTKTIPDFHCLQQRLLPVCPELKQQALPSANKPRFRSYNQPFLDKTQPILQRFLDFVMKEERLNRSDALYSFFSQGPDPLEQDLPAAKKGFPFPLLQFFRNLSGPSLFDSNEEDDDLFFSDRDLEEKIEKGRKLKSTLCTHAQKKKNAFHPKTVAHEEKRFRRGDKLRQQTLHACKKNQKTFQRVVTRRKRRDEKEREAYNERIMEVRCKFARLRADILNVVGQQNARKGAAKAFDILQNVRLNKQLFYDLLGAFLLEFAPELRPH